MRMRLATLAAWIAAWNAVVVFSAAAASSPSGRSDWSVSGSSIDSQEDTVVVQFDGDAYRLVAIPLLQTTTGLVEQLEAQLGDADDTKWRLSTRNTATGEYLHAGRNVVPLGPGIGYWTIAAQDGDATVRGRSVKSDDTTFVIALQNGPGNTPGWNQIGNPFMDACVPLEQVYVSDGLSVMTITEAIPRLLGDVIKEYEPGAGAGGRYWPASRLEALRGYWVKKQDTGIVELIVPNTGCSSLAEPKARTNTPAVEWAFQVNCWADGATAPEPLRFGAASVPADGWNHLCSSLAPPPPDCRVQLFFDRCDLGTRSGQYVSWFRPVGDSLRWDFVIDPLGATRRLSLQVEAEHGGDDVALYLRQAGAHRWIPTPPGTNLELQGRGEFIAMELLATIRATDDGRRAISREVVLDVSPNPFSSETLVRCRLHSANQCDVAVYDVSGRCLRRLLQGSLRSGETAVMWDGTDDAGRPVADGAYVVRLEAGSGIASHRVTRIR